MQYSICYRKKNGGWQYLISYKTRGIDRWRQKAKQGFRLKRDAKRAASEALEDLKDNRSPDLGILAKIADFLNVNSDFLLMRTNNFSTYIKREVEGELIEIIFDDEKLHLTSDDINKLFEQLKPFGFDPKKYFDSIDRKN